MTTDYLQESVLHTGCPQTICTIQFFDFDVQRLFAECGSAFWMSTVYWQNVNLHPGCPQAVGRMWFCILVVHGLFAECGFAFWMSMDYLQNAALGCTMTTCRKVVAAF